MYLMGNIKHHMTNIFSKVKHHIGNILSNIKHHIGKIKHHMGNKSAYSYDKIVLQMPRNS